ncbi:uncharacterized protein [Excalfactoria chinensis]|uniref:uncharacterized protein n=1 Tax=Excalfactoria chinensis TaxID=46218 RepID=UPI003B3A0F8F
MHPTSSRAVPVPLQPVAVPVVTYVGPQASTQPWVRGVQRQGAQLPPGGLPHTVVQLLPGGLPPNMVQLPHGGLPPAVVQLPPGGLPPTVVQLPFGGLPSTVVQLPPGGLPPTVVQLPPGGLPPNMVQLPHGGLPPTVVQLPFGGLPPTVVQLPPGGLPPTVVQLPPGGLPPNMVQLPHGGLPPNMVQLPPGGLPPNVAQLPPEAVPIVVGQLPPEGQDLPLLMLLPGGVKPSMPPPNAPAHYCQHPQLAGTLQPQQPMGRGPGAVSHGEPPQPAGSCSLQAPGHRHRKVRKAPPRQHQVITVRCKLPAGWAQKGQPRGDAVVYTEDQQQPAPTNVSPRPTNVSPRPTTAPLTCSTAAPESGGEFGDCRVGGLQAVHTRWLWGSWQCLNGDVLAFPAATTSSDVQEDIDDLLAWMNSSAESSTDIQADSQDMEDLLTWLNSEVASLQEVPQQNQDLIENQTEGTKDPMPTTVCNGSIQATKRKLPQGQDAPEPKRWR